MYRAFKFSNISDFHVDMLHTTIVFISLILDIRNETLYLLNFLTYIVMIL